MRKGFLVIIAIFLFLSGALFFSLNTHKDNIRIGLNSGTCISAEIARTDSEKQLGLSYRETLGKNEGMLFTYESEEARAFWMKNMKIPIDIIWLDKDKDIVYIHENLQPCKTASCPMYLPDKKAMYALEVNAGFVKENNISAGDKVSF